MTESKLLFVILLIVTLQGLVASSSFSRKLDVQKQLASINKPAVKSFTTKHGEILDCVEIYKQLAFDHPLLKNYTFPLKDSGNRTKRRKPKADSVLSQFISENMVCPEGTVMVKRVQEQDLLVDKMLSSFVRSNLFGSHSPNPGQLNGNQEEMTINWAYVQAPFENTGAAGDINVWKVEVSLDQISLAALYVVSANNGDRYKHNMILAGWAVIPDLYQNNASRIFAYWSRDGGHTGCYNVVCPGFIYTPEAKRGPPLGLMLDKISTYQGEQHTLGIKIQQNDETKDWNLYIEDDVVGHWPKELFSDAFKTGARRAGWGGSTYTKGSEPAPAMGSGHFPDQGFGQASFISNLDLYGVHQFPDYNDLQYVLTKPECYEVVYRGVDENPAMGRVMYFGGPPGCPVQS